MHQTVRTAAQILNYLSYLMLSISLLLLMQFSTSNHLLDFRWYQSNNDLIILRHKDYHQLNAQDTIYYYQEKELAHSQVRSVNPPKFRIDLHNGSFTTPSQYLGTKLTVLPLYFSLSSLNLLLLFTTLLLLSILLTILHHHCQNRMHK